jgi:beta-N-acetylhexosaminidase
LNRVELPPFREAVKDGVAMVMVAHLLVPALDPEKPVTFSKKTVTALLREGMEFGGLIVSDALDMGALAGTFSQEEIAVRAVEAGMDILLHPVEARATINAVVSAVEQGRLAHERIRESAMRILSAKKRLGLFDKENKPAREIDYNRHREIARELGRKAIKVISGDAKILPLDPARGAACFVLDDDGAGNTGEAFLREMTGRLQNMRGAVLTPDSEFSLFHARDAVAGAGSVVLAIFSRISASKGRSGISPKLKDAALEILRMAKAAGKRSVVISFDSPYILGQFKDADLLIAGYDRMEEIQSAAADMLAGK